MSWCSNQLGLASGCIGPLGGWRENFYPGRLQWQRVGQCFKLVSSEAPYKCWVAFRNIQGQYSNVPVDDRHFPGHLFRWRPNRVPQLFLSSTRCRWRRFLVEYSLSIRTAVMAQLMTLQW
jgi:hypothetical protein